MDTQSKNSSLVAISRWVGGGRVAPQGGGKLMFAHRGGEGILWPLAVDGTQQWLWCDEQQWCAWASPVISAEGLLDLSTDMLSVASELVGYEITAFSGKNVIWQTPVKGCAAVMTGPVFHFSKDERWLECRLLEWSAETLQQLTCDWLPETIDGDEQSTLRCSASLQIGTLSATLAQITQWRAGDGVLISHPAQLSRSQLWFSVGDRRLLMGLQPSGEFIMEQSQSIEENDNSSRSDEELAHINDIRFTVSVEIGQISLSLPELLNLQPGDCISGEMNIEHEVSLIMQGRKIGRGNLLNIDKQWVVRISEIN
jgi:type III secretion system YscQ/HrcQ family protein